MEDTGTLQWSDALLTGVEEIDQQHRFLVDLLVEVRVTLARGMTPLIFERMTRDLLAYAIYHFATEEQLMQRHGYGIAAPESAQCHLDQHRSFSGRVVALRGEARLGEPGSQAALLSFLEDWLVTHIQTTDQHLGQFICSSTLVPQAALKAESC